MIQDCPKDTSEIERELTSNFLVIKTELGTESHNNNRHHPTKLNTIINLDKCRVASKHRIGNRQAAGLMVHVVLERNERPSTNQLILLTNIYIRPRASYTELANLLSDIIARSAGKMSRLVIAGDLNASAPGWDPCHVEIDRKARERVDYHELKIIRGNTLSYFATKHGLSFLKQNSQEPKPTFVTKTGSEKLVAWIDAVLVGSKAARIWHSITVSWNHERAVTAMDDQGMNRSHGMLTVNNCKSQQDKGAAYTHRYRANKISADHLVELTVRTRKTRNNWQLAEREQQIARLESLTNAIMTTALRLQETHAKTLVRRIRNSCDTEQLVKRLVKLDRKIKKLNKFKPLYAHVPALCSLKRKNQKHQRAKKKLINQLKRRIENDPNDLWTRVHRSEKHLFKEAAHSGQMIETQDQLDQLATKLFPQAIDRNLPIHILEQHEPIYLKDQELLLAERTLRNKKYTGPDGLRFSIFNRIISLVPELIRDVAKMSFRTGHIPDYCTQTQGILIPKKAQGKFRVVHIATPMAAYLEVIALNRLEFALESKGLKDRHQYGFTRHRGRHDLVASIIASIAKHRVHVRENYADKATAKHNQTTIVSLDVLGAFDNVDQVSIIEKLYRELGSDPIKHWVKSFMLNRNIKIKYQKLASKSLGVYRGVPQGSALGPILWNYSIHDIQQRINLSDPFIELVAYADDLTLISHGSDNHRSTQRALDQINQYIRDRKLEISTEKSELIHIIGPGRRPKEYELPRLTISDCVIEAKNRLKILGIPITQTLLLYIEDEGIQQKLANSKRLLRYLKASRIVCNMNEWKVLFEALVKSILIYNFIPMLAIDVRAQIWADKNMIYTIMYALGLSKHTSHNLIQILTNCETAYETAYRQISIRATEANISGDLREVYMTLKEILLHDGLLSYIQKTAQPVPGDQRTQRPVSTTSRAQLTTIRHHFNPKLEMQTCKGIPNRAGSLAWVISNHIAKERTKQPVCTAALVLFNNIPQASILKEEHIYNQFYSINYYNTLATLWKRAQDNRLTSSLIINEADSTAQALLNLANRDSKVIKLRELLAARNMVVHLADKASMTELISCVRRASAKTEQMWVQCNWPPVSLRKLRNQNIKILETMQTSRRNRQLTRTMRSLCSDQKWWTKIALDQLSNQTLMMLSGLVTNSCRQLVRGELARDQTTYPGCACDRSQTDEPSTLIHRLTCCPLTKGALGPFKQSDPLTKARRILTEKDKSLTKEELLRILTRLVI